MVARDRVKGEVYLWVCLIAAIAAIAFYFRFFYQPLISLTLGISPAAQPQIYPYQKAQFSIEVFNNGTNAITNMSLGVVVNGNLTTLYKVTLPAGKQTTILYNYSPTTAGSYTIGVVADPSKLYNIVDRSHSQAYTSLSVLQAQSAAPSSLLPKANITSFRQATLTSGAYLMGSYMHDHFNVSLFELTRNGQIDQFLKPIFNLTSYYIKNVSMAEANYSNNDSAAYSIWVRGYLSPSIFSAATLGSSLSTVNVSTSDGEVTFIKMHNDTTFCGWYSGGWLKILAEKNTEACYRMINSSSANPSQVQMQGLGAEFGQRLSASNSTALGNYSVIAEGGDYLARLLLVRNTSFVYDTISNGSMGMGNATCFGVIGEANGTSYCSTYIFPRSGAIGSFALIRTTAYKGGYNLTAFSLVNTTLALNQVPVAESILQRLNVSGRSLAFASGIVDTCQFNSLFACGNVTYNNGTISFWVKNNLNSSVVLNSIKCYRNAGIISTTLNKTLAEGASYEIKTACYSLATPITGLQLNLHLSLALNYTSSNASRVVFGSAFIPFG